MKRFTLSTEQLTSVITAMAIAYEGYHPTVEVEYLTSGSGEYSLIPVHTETGEAIEEARTVVSNDYFLSQQVAITLQNFINKLIGD